ncbi:MAG: hypothetical protein ABW007_04440 [Chitinophagaceae bacterium]
MIGFIQALTAALVGYLPAHSSARTGTESMLLSASQKGSVVQLTLSGNISGDNYYVIQKKIDQHYYTIDSIRLSGQGLQTLTYTEAYASPGINKYRVKKSGCKNEQFSNEYAINFASQNRLTLSTSPGSKTVTAFHCPGGQQDNIVVLDTHHKTVLNMKVKTQKSFTIIDFTGLSNGLYHIGWKSGGAFIYQSYVVE